MFSKKATKKISSIFVDFLENTNFTNKTIWQISALAPKEWSN